MYEQYYRFSEKPFGLTPDPKYLYRSESHVKGLELLQQAIARRECFAVVTGDVGTGKTTLCRALLERTDKKTFVALLRNPPVSEEDLLEDVLRDLGVASLGDERAAELRPQRQELTNTLHDFLVSLASLRATSVLIVDEAQALPIATLEQIRVLSNLAADKETLLQVVLVGQLSLQSLLRTPELRQLDQRLSLRCQLTPLSEDETTAYIAHRLGVAGGLATVTVTPAALQAVHRYSRGIPRLINLICHRALLAGQAAQTTKIGADLVSSAAEALDLKEGETVRRPWFSRFRSS